MLNKELEKLFLDGNNILLTGQAGTGKTYNINKIIEKYGKGKKIALCATTGIAAQLINGQTIHSFLNLGLLRSNDFETEWKRIVFNKKFEIPQRYYDMYNYTIGIPLDFKNFISIENQYFEDIRNKQITNLPKGVVLDYIPSIRENMIEKSFEWEETKKP